MSPGVIPGVRGRRHRHITATQPGHGHTARSRRHSQVPATLVRSRRSQRGERGLHPGPPGGQRVNDLEVPGTGQLIQFRVIVSGAGLGEVVAAHATRHPVIGGTVNQAHRAAHRQKLHRIGQAIPVRMPARTTAEQRPSRALAESESMTSRHVTNGGKGHHSTYLPLGDVPARIRRKPVPGRCPQRQVPASRMPAEEHRPIADQVSADGLPDEGRQRVHGAGDIVERAGPAAATLASAAELRDAHREPRGRERRRERAGVCPVIGCPPEPSMQEQHQWRRPRARCLSAARHPTHARRRCAGPRRHHPPHQRAEHAEAAGARLRHAPAQVHRRSPGPAAEPAWTARHQLSTSLHVSHSARSPRPGHLPNADRPPAPIARRRRSPACADRSQAPITVGRTAPAPRPTSPPGPDPIETHPAPADSCARPATRTPARPPRSGHSSVMKVYFLRLTGKLEPGDRGWFEVSSYSGWECLAR